MEELAALVEANEDLAAAIAAAYEVLLGGVPNVAGFEFLINNALETNFGADEGVVFNQENIFINVANALVQGNPDAAAGFAELTAGAASLADKVEALYNAFVPAGARSDAGLEFLIRPEALAFYAEVAAERGVAGPDGAAIVALASLLNILVDADLAGIGDSVNDLLAAIADGSAQLPASGNTFTPIEDADGTNFDGDDDVGVQIELTTNIDTPGTAGPGANTLGTDGDDVYIANSLTLNPGDNLDGLLGDDKVELFLGGQGLESDFVDNLNSKSVETVQVTAQIGLIGLLTQGILSLNMENAEGVETVINQSSTTLGFIFNSLQNQVDVELRDLDQIDPLLGLLPFESFSATVIDYEEASLAGKSITQNILVEDSSTILAIDVLGDDVVGALNIEVVGPAGSVLGIADLEPLGAGDNIMPTTITVTGNAFLGLTDIDDEFEETTLIDASGNTGGTYVNAFNNLQDLTFKGGAGIDGIVFGEGEFGKGDVVDGGANADFIGIDFDDIPALGAATLTSVESLLLIGDTDGDVTFEDIDNSGFERILVAGTVDAGDVFTLEDADDLPIYFIGDFPIDPLNFNAGGASVTHAGDIVFADTDDLNLFIGLDSESEDPEQALVNGAFQQLGDALPGSPDADNWVDVTFDNVDITDVETITLTIAHEFSDAIVNYVTNSAAVNALETFKIIGAGDFDLNGGDDNFDDLTFDLTELTGNFDNAGVGASGNQTFLLGDVDDSTIALGGPNDAKGDLANDFVVFTTADFGDITIEGFGWDNNDVTKDDILDFSALDLSIADFTFTQVGADLEISSSAFSGVITLLGVGVVPDYSELLAL